MGYWQFSAGEVLVPYENMPKWRTTIGPTVNYQPKYEGSQHYGIEPGINFEIRYKERLYLNTGEGLGYDIIRTRNIRAGLSATYDLGREANITELRGMGDIQAAVQFRAYGEYVFRPKVMDHEFPIIASLALYRALGGYDGMQGDLGLYMPIAGSEAGRWFIFAGGSANFADQNAQQSFFGVTPRQAAATGYRAFTPSSGFRSYGFGTDMGWFFTEHWLISGSFGCKWLVDDAAHSPIVFDKFQFQSNLGIGYQF
jgi:outer membrane scaffolding protein for murein synthesis (MipA/OmpV family)